MKHLEDITPNELLTSLLNFDKCVLQEKMDGYSSVFGVDEDGKFYSSREAKNGQRFYSVSEYGNGSWATSFRASHKAASDLIAPFLKPGDSVQVELIPNNQPNAVPYDVGSVGRIVVLSVFSGAPDIKNFDYKKTSEVRVESPETLDARTVKFRVREMTFKLERCPESKPDAFVKVAKSLGAKYREFLMADSEFEPIPNKTVLDLLSLPLNRRPEGVDSADYKIFKDELGKKIRALRELDQKFRAGIKDTLLKTIVHPAKSKFGQNVENGFIEGYVIRYKDLTPWKLVDKTLFTELNAWNHLVRTKILEIRDNQVNSTADAVNFPSIKSLLMRKKILADRSLIPVFKETDVRVARNILNSSISSLENLLNQYLKSASNFKKSFEHHGHVRTFTYDGEIHTRTMMAFAETRCDFVQKLTLLEQGPGQVLNVMLPVHLRIKLG